MEHGLVPLKKTGSLIPKDRKHVSHMVGKAFLAGAHKIQNKHKINPDGGSNA